MTQLIYHEVMAADGSVSAFDKCIMEIVAGQDLRIACPYLSLPYLERILKKGGKEWQLLTDVEELLHSQTKGCRKKFAKFIEEHRNTVRDLEGLHSKVIIAGEKGFVGSANFTKSGMCKRTEMSVVLSNREHVEELHRWFDLLWCKSDEIKPSTLDMLIQELPPCRPYRPLLRRKRILDTTLSDTLSDEVEFYHAEDNLGYKRNLPKRLCQLSDGRWAVAFGEMIKACDSREEAKAELRSKDFYKGYKAKKLWNREGIELI